ncbi:MAG: pyruvate dehydrogenase (acetyl-transferring), homodimeric type [Deltaproteobacteria bacterium]|jgi:pyruvate dehydrogenase E1 component|nr:pyruvate dehydrogenase (acetyl-transferring), homodimeric type [Deltaproteobacteria bacterium]MBW2530629.1 pyruvate dehydrogenase (acetyl-transferring), homodimeric type [Deltaproteobacteria bacterium]
MTSFEQFKQQLPDPESIETREWTESLDEVVERSGRTRAQFLLYKVLKRARMLNLDMPPTTQTRYINTISPEQEPAFPGDEQLERRIRRLIRWNAVAMVHRANQRHPGLGGHLSSYASAASLYEVGFNHFFRGSDAPGGADAIYFQGHSAPGIYARAFLEGRLSAEQLDHFRRESRGLVAGEPTGLSSYPHPRLMPGFWEYPTVSMGLGSISAIYRARFHRYLHGRGLADTSDRRVWAFLGDGETDEPESIGALSLAAREGLDNLVFVVNCNLQRLDGPVRGNGKIVQELESLFRGAGWNVLKVLWGREWDSLLAQDVDGLLLERMNETLDGDWQRFAVAPGAVIRDQFFGPDPRLRAMVEDLTDDELRRLRRGGHDYRKLYAAYRVAVETEGRPTVILAKTVKGWTLGGEVEGRNVTHQVKKLSLAELRVFRDRLELPIDDAALEEAPYYHPGPDSPEVQYMLERRRALGGPVPRRAVVAVPAELPAEGLYGEFFAGTGDKLEASTTMAYVRMLRKLMKSRELGKAIVPIVPDEARTFGMDPLFSEFKIYSPLGQRYTPVDAEFLISYREGTDGQILQEGITEAGAMASFTAAGTSYADTGVTTVPFFLLYSMFGFQRVADLIWAFADTRGRGFLLGATAGRTTLNGEGLQHQDGQSLLYASTVPSCRAYDPAFAYEAAAITRAGLRAMVQDQQDVFYYLTLYNEAYPMPAMPDGVEEGILAGLYPLSRGSERGQPRAQLLGSGPLVREALRAQQLLADRFGVDSDVWSVTSYGELRRDALSVERQGRLRPDEPEPRPYLVRALEPTEGPIVAVSDYVKAVPELVARWMPRRFVALGTDGFGRSDTRAALRRYFEVDAEHIAAAALSALARDGAYDPRRAAEALADLGLVAANRGREPRG